MSSMSRKATSRRIGGHRLWYDDGGAIQDGQCQFRGGHAADLKDLFHHHHLGLRRVSQENIRLL